MILMQIPDFEGNLITKELDGNYLITKSHKGEILNIKELNYLEEGKKTKFGIIKSIKEDIVIFNNKKTATKEVLNSYIAKSLAPKPQSTAIKGTYVTPNGIKVELPEHSPNLRQVITNPDYMRESGSETLLRKSNTTIIIKKKPLINEAVLKSVEIKEIKPKEVTIVKSEQKPKNKVLVLSKGLKFNFMKYAGTPQQTPTSLDSNNSSSNKESKTDTPSTGVRWNVKGGEKPGHKYIQRKPNKTGDGWIYLYKLPDGTEEWQDADGKKVEDSEMPKFQTLAKFPDFQAGDKILYSGLKAKVLEVSDNYLAILDERGHTTTVDKNKYLEKQNLWDNYQVGQEINYKGKTGTITRKTDLVATIRDEKGDLLGVLQKPTSMKKLSSGEYNNNFTPDITDYKKTEEYKNYNFKSNNHGFAKVNDLTRVKYFKDGNETHKITWVYNALDHNFDVTIDGDPTEIEHDGSRLIDIDTDGGFIYQTRDGSLEKRDRNRPEPQLYQQPEEEKQDPKDYMDELFGDEEETPTAEETTTETENPQEQVTTSEEEKTWKDKIDKELKLDDVERRTGVKQDDGTFNYTFKMTDGSEKKANFTPEEVEKIDEDFRKHAVNKKIIGSLSKKKTEKAPRMTKAEKKKQELEEQAIKEIEERKEEIKQIQESEEFKKWVTWNGLTERNGYKIDGTRATKKAKFGDYDFTITHEFDENNLEKLPHIKGPAKSVMIRGEEYYIMDIREFEGRQSLAIKKKSDGDNTSIDIDTLEAFNGKGLFKPENMKGIKSDKGVQDVYIGKDPYKVEYEIIEADDLKVSHDYDVGSDTFLESEGYNIPQNRTYTSQSDKAKVINIAHNPEFGLLGEGPTVDNGAPTVTGDYQAIGGNGRGMGIKLGYSTHEDSYKYKKDLLENAEKLGFSKDDIQNMNKPVLVRKLLNVSNEEAVSLAGKTNVSNMAAQSPYEIASSKVNSMKEEDKSSISEMVVSAMRDIGESATLGQSLDAVANKLGDFLLNNKFIESNEKSSYADENGNYKGEAFKDIVLNIALGKVANNYEKLNENIKNKINRVVPYLMQINSKKRDKFKQSFENGVKLTQLYKAEALPKESLVEYLNRKQQQSIGEKMPTLSQFDIAMADAFINDKVDAITEKFNAFYMSNATDMPSFDYDDIEDEEEALKRYFVEIPEDDLSFGKVISEAAKAFPNGFGQVKKGIFAKLLKYLRL